MLNPDSKDEGLELLLLERLVVVFIKLVEDVLESLLIGGSIREEKTSPGLVLDKGVELLQGHSSHQVELGVADAGLLEPGGEHLRGAGGGRWKQQRGQFWGEGKGEHGAIG